MATNGRKPIALSTAVDRALELYDLRVAAQAYASRHGSSGSARYRAAWLRFRQRIRSTRDFQQLREKAAREQRGREVTKSPEPAVGHGTSARVQLDFASHFETLSARFLRV